MGQELPGHVARADGKRVRESGRWPLTQDGLCASTSTIHDQQRVGDTGGKVAQQ